MAPRDIAVIIVNYGTARLTLEAVDSILQYVPGRRSLQIYIVDNASPGPDARLLAAEIAARGWQSQVELLASRRNVGFGAGNNLILASLATAAQPPRYVFLLNPDARLENDAINILADFLDEHPSVAAAGAGIDSPRGEPVTAAFRFPGIVSTFAGALGFGPVSRALRRWQVSLPPTTTTQPVDWVAGAAVLLRYSAILKAGFFDPTYFLYFEEVDLLRQLKRQGGEIWDVAEARVVHIEGASTGVRSGNSVPRRLPAYWYESWRHYFLKNHGRAAAIMAALAWYTGAAGNTLLQALRGRQPQAPQGFYRDFWRVAVRPLLGLRPLPYE